MDNLQWLTYLPNIQEDVYRPIFIAFLERTSFLMSTYESLDIQKQMELLMLSNALLQLYQSADGEMRERLLNEVIGNFNFIHLSLKTSCDALVASIGISHHNCVLKCRPAIAFLSLVNWSIDSSNGIQTQKYMNDNVSCVARILLSLSLLPTEVVNTLHEQDELTRVVWLFFKLLYKCASAVNPDILTSCFQILQRYIHTPDVEVRVMHKAVLCSLPDHNFLTLLCEDELQSIASMLKTDLAEPFSFHNLSFGTLFSMIKDLLASNVSGFVRMDVASLVGDVMENLVTDGVRMQATELIWLLMQAAEDSTSTDEECSTLPTSLNAQQEKDLSSLQRAIESESFKVSIPEDACVIDFTVFMTRYIIRAIIPYECLPIEKIAEELENSVWYTIGAGVSVMQIFLSQSSEKVRAAIVQEVSCLPQICKAVHVALQAGFVADQTGVIQSIMKDVIGDLFALLMLWTDGCQSLAREVAVSGLIQSVANILHVANIAKPHTEDITRTTIHALFVLLNCAYDSWNYPAFMFANAIEEVIPFLESTNFDIASTSKYILSCLNNHLDCHQLFHLKISETEAQYCVSTLATTASSPNYKDDGFALHEILKILIHLTKPYQSLSSLFKGDLSDFENKMIGFSVVMEENVQLLHSCGILNAFHSLVLAPCETYMAKTAQLLWNLLHCKAVKQAALSDFPNIVSALKAIAGDSNSSAQLACHCACWLLGLCERSYEGMMKYLEGCYSLECYEEVITVASEMLTTLHSNEHWPAKLLKGKAMFHVYQRKLMYLMKNRNYISKPTAKKLVDECLVCIREAVSCLGSVFDEHLIDEEGSRLLDWAMMDCVRETNQLNLCKRCFLCRQGGRDLIHSHIIPESFLRNTIKHKQVSSKKPLLFGLDKYQLKSAGDCWLWLCCRRCELTMSQNAENDFCRLFPCSGNVHYSSWLFNFCITIIFRTLSCVKFPRSFNDLEVYEALLFCRRHLLSLPVKINQQVHIFSEDVLSQICKCYDVHVCLEPYIFSTPSDMFEDGHNSLLAMPWLSCHRLVDGRMDQAGLSHFFVVYYSEISFLLRFSPSAKFSLPECLRISQQSGVFSFPQRDNVATLIPRGLYMLTHRILLKKFQDISQHLHELSLKGAKKLVSSGHFFSEIMENFNNISSKADESYSESISLNFETINKPQMRFLPQEFEIVQPHSYTLLRKRVSLPEGHQIILHHVIEESDECCSVFLAVGNSTAFPSNRPYVAFLYKRKDVSYLDGAFIADVDGKICFTHFILNHDVAIQCRPYVQNLIDTVQESLSLLLLKNGYTSLQALVQHLKCRLSLKARDQLPSLGMKCSPEGCWYCCDLCHLCLKPTGHSEISSLPYKFCTNNCQQLFCCLVRDNESTMIAMHHNNDLKSGNFFGPSVLDILTISKEEGKGHNTVKFLSLCLGENSTEPSSLYILWQIREIDFQVFYNFSVTNDCVFLQYLWSPLEGSEVGFLSQVLSKHQVSIANSATHLVERAVTALGHESIQTYLSPFLDAFVKEKN